MHFSFALDKRVSFLSTLALRVVSETGARENFTEYELECFAGPFEFTLAPKGEHDLSSTGAHLGLLNIFDFAFSASRTLRFHTLYD